MIDRRVLYQRLVPSRALLVYFYLEDRCDFKRECFPSFNRISLDLGVSRSTVIRAVSDLESLGLITVIRRKRRNGGKTSNLYKLGGFKNAKT